MKSILFTLLPVLAVTTGFTQNQPNVPEKSWDGMLAPSTELLYKNIETSSSGHSVQMNTPAGWSGFSSNVVPSSSDVETLFLPWMEQLIILYNQQGTFYPAQQINTLVNWNPLSGYVLKLETEAEIHFSGTYIQNRKIELAAGWNLIPVLSTCPADIAGLFKNKEVRLVKEVAGYRLFWPEMGINTLGELLPGKAYYVLMLSPAQILFPNCGLQPWQCGDELTDTRDGQIYSTVQIGEQCWMARNLNTGVIVNPYEQSDNGMIEKTCYENDPAACDEYGGLYFWDEMMNYSSQEFSQGICPAGWHVPKAAEWDIMIASQGGSGIAGGKLKETGYTHWNEPNAGATNSSGFSAVGGGLFADGFFGKNQAGLYFSSSRLGGSDAITKMLSADNTRVDNIYAAPENYLHGSVRCLQTQCPAISAALAGDNLLNTAGNSIILEGNSPVNTLYESGQWSIIAGNNGFFYGQSYPHSAFTGNAGESYTLVWTISNVCGVNSADTVTVSFSPPAVSNCNGITEISYEGQTYHTVQIGNQCWIKENLNAGVMVDGYTAQTNNNTLEKYCYNNEADSCAQYGGLYQWNELMQYSLQPGSRGICPEGWHIPTSYDGCLLATYLDPAADCNNSFDIISETAGGKLKETGYSHWEFPNDGATNETGFTMLGSGVCGYGNFEGNRWLGKLATSTRMTEEYYYGNVMVNVQAHYRRQPAFLTDAVAVRCIKDSEIPAWSCGQPFTDTRDHQAYNTVQIGDQCWMQENMNIGNMIPPETQGQDNGLIEKYCYDNSQAKCSEYGGFYSWPEMMQYNVTPGTQGICPEGFHIPADEEWIQLSEYLGGSLSAGGKLKETGFTHWLDPNTGATNESGFTALGTGFSGGFFMGYQAVTYMWSSTIAQPGKAWYRYLASDSSIINRAKTHGMTFGFSVRCLRN